MGTTRSRVKEVSLHNSIKLVAIPGCLFCNPGSFGNFPQIIREISEYYNQNLNDHPDKIIVKCDYLRQARKTQEIKISYSDQEFLLCFSLVIFEGANK